MVDKRKIIAETKDKGEYCKWEIKNISDNFLSSILETLQRGEDVNLSGFGRFELKVRKARNVIHPKTKQPVHIPEKINVVFTVSRKFKPEEGLIETLNARNTSSK